ncbi:uncharacterized protein LOC113460377 isoform X2 [Zonotrichia albicollis]|uniref:uncharacterized protein LOC113460377 isoform X2 n=1 Tax=Zonotrichia albicollis TaxID=44394 RepID=UPI003D811D03
MTLAWEERQYFLSYSTAGAVSWQQCSGGASGARAGARQQLCPGYRTAPHSGAPGQRTAPHSGARDIAPARPLLTAVPGISHRPGRSSQRCPEPAAAQGSLPSAAGSGLRPPSLLPRDSLAGSCRRPGSSKAAIKHPGDLTANTNNSGCLLRLDSSCSYPARIHGTSRASRQVFSDPFANSGSDSRDLSQPQDRHTRIPGYPVILDGFVGEARCVAAPSLEQRSGNARQHGSDLFTRTRDGAPGMRPGELGGGSTQEPSCTSAVHRVQRKERSRDADEQGRRIAILILCTLCRMCALML